jgi:hypothetical protein
MFVFLMFGHKILMGIYKKEYLKISPQTFEVLTVF